jgi:hypothetical protein
MTQRHTRPRRSGLAPLIALNAFLLAVLAAVVVGPTALAQPGGREPAPRPAGEYTLVGGDIQTGNSNAVYVIDSVNREMVVLRWVDGRNLLEGIGYRDLGEDTRARPRR